MTAQTFELNHCYNMDCMEAMAASVYMRYCVLLRASDRRGTKECLQYTLDAINTEEAACEAKKQAAEHYTEFELFDVQSIGEVRT